MSVASVLWVQGIYVIWFLNRIEIQHRVTDGTSRLHASALVFYEFKWHDISILLLSLMILVCQVGAVVGRLRGSGSSRGAPNEGMHPTGKKGPAGDAQPLGRRRAFWLGFPFDRHCASDV